MSQKVQTLQHRTNVVVSAVNTNSQVVELEGECVICGKSPIEGLQPLACGHKYCDTCLQDRFQQDTEEDFEMCLKCNTDTIMTQIWEDMTKNISGIIFKVQQSNGSFAKACK